MAQPPPNPPLDTAQVLAEEYREIYPLVGPPAPGHAPSLPDETTVRDALFDAGTTALCLSGGGIRSASFCLGAVQGLARVGLLSKFHYFSTVSGGGYLGSLIAAWAYREPTGIAAVERTLGGGGYGAATPVGWWREYLSYLAPRRGLLSLDTWTLFSTYLRNFILNALVWLPLIGAALTLPHLLASFVDAIATGLRGTPALNDWAMVTIFAGTAALILATVQVRYASGRGERGPALTKPRPQVPEWLKRATREVVRAMEPGRLFQPPLFLGAIMMPVGMHWLGYSDERFVWQRLTQETTELARYVGFHEDLGRVFPFALVYAMGNVLAAFYYQPLHRVSDNFKILATIAGFFCGLITGVLLGVLMTSFGPTGTSPMSLPLMITVLPALVIAAVGLGEILFVGATSKWSSDYDREWWARAGAWALMFATAWTALCALSFYGPLLLRALPKLGAGQWPYWITVILSTAAVARVVLVTGRTAPSETRPRAEPRKLDRVLDIVALALLIALLAGIADLVASGLNWIADATSGSRWRAPADGRDYAVTDALLMLVVFGVVLALASWGVNINRFSLHAMYRDRLIRAFLGATRGEYPAPAWELDTPRREEFQFRSRRAEPFILFDPDDNPIFRWLRVEPAPGLRDPRKRPFLLVNAALNLVGGDVMAWQERKARSFTMSALHTGSPGLGYRTSAQYASDQGGITLGTAMAVSGAAVSPNAGAFSSPVRTFLLTLFNARLGWWLGHPHYPERVSKSGPRFAVVPMLRELFGRTDDKSRWIFVSDGGHFDNLGIYEAVRRGCQTIVAIDSSCDPFRNFDDLGNAIRKVRIDMGVTIRRASPWALGGRDLQEKGRYCALFDIVYSEGANARVGKLIYVKPSFYLKAQGLPIDILQYAGRAESFPHEPTSDQFFTESQFESYRALGEFEIAEIAGVRQLTRVEDLIDLASIHLGNV